MNQTANNRRVLGEGFGEEPSCKKALPNDSSYPSSSPDIPEEYRWLLDESLDEIMAAVDEKTIELIEVIGLEATLKLMARYEGMSLYLPMFPGPFLSLRHKRIRSEFTGSNHAALAKRYSMALSSIYRILRPEEKQGDLFGVDEERS